MRVKGHKNARIVIKCAAISVILFCQASAQNTINDPQKNFDLKIYLPREVKVKDANLSLGQVSVIQGKESFLTKANNIAIGRISVMNQIIVIDRPTILSRLASNGISSSKVLFSGSEKTIVRRQQRAISGQEFVDLASAFLKNNSPDASICQWNAIRKPKDLVIPKTDKEIRFSPRLSLNRTKNQARVEITVLSGNKKIGVRNVTFALKYDCRQAVAISQIAKGTTIGPENVKIEIVPSNYPEPIAWKSPYGLVAKRPLAANTILRPSMVGTQQSPVVVKRNQGVVIRIEKPGFSITAAGMSLEDGRVGEFVRVRNVDSKRIILARISDDGSVEPML